MLYFDDDGSGDNNMVDAMFEGYGSSVGSEDGDSDEWEGDSDEWEGDPESDCEIETMK